MVDVYSLPGQPLHKRERKSLVRIMPICELELSGVCKTGLDEVWQGQLLLVSEPARDRYWCMVMWSDLIALHSSLQQYNLCIYRHDSCRVNVDPLSLVKGI